MMYRKMRTTMQRQAQNQSRECKLRDFPMSLISLRCLYDGGNMLPTCHSVSSLMCGPASDLFCHFLIHHFRLICTLQAEARALIGCAERLCNVSRDCLVATRDGRACEDVLRLTGLHIPSPSSCSRATFCHTIYIRWHNPSTSTFISLTRSHTSSLSREHSPCH